MYFTENPEQIRSSFFLLQDNLEKTMVETIRLLNVNWIRDKILVFSYQESAMIVWAPGAYTKIAKCTVQKNGKKMKLDLLAYHDSCWPEGVKRFLDDLLKDFIEKHEKNPDLCSFDFTIRTMNILNLEELPKDFQEALRNLDYSRASYDIRKKTFKVNYCRDLFPLMTHEMDRVEKQK